MKKYLINYLNSDTYDIIITLLDYETRISECLKSIKISSLTKKKILIDTALCSGMNQYRFIEAALIDNEAIDLTGYMYVNVDAYTEKNANDIISKRQLSINNSILTANQKELLRIKA